MISLFDPFRVIKKPVTSEKAINMIERENKLTFIVDRRSNKKEIKRAFEKLFEEPVQKVNTLITPKGEKKAIIKLKRDGAALDIAVKLGII